MYHFYEFMHFNIFYDNLVLVIFMMKPHMHHKKFMMKNIFEEDSPKILLFIMQLVM